MKEKDDVSEVGKISALSRFPGERESSPASHGKFLLVEDS